LTAVGKLHLARTYFVCVGCRDSAHPLDERLGIDGYLTHEARRLVCLAGASWSFDTASGRLREFCGLDASDELIRRTTESAGAKLADWMAHAPASAQAFRAAAGESEFETDALKVNTTAGWRDLKIGLFCKRPRGEGVGIDRWADRTLPRATARFAFAAIAESRDFAARWRPTAEHLGLNPDTPDLTVIADGAEWIWNRAAEAFPAAGGVLDIFHGIEHIAGAATACFGEGTAATREQTERGRDRLLADGYHGIVEWVGGLSADAVAGAATGQLLNYFAGHQNRLNYVLRLRRGQTIGSGQIEGAAKTMIGRRMKLNNCRWLEGNANKMCGAASALYANCWAAYWNAA
jgi:hypothetical protein